MKIAILFAVAVGAADYFGRSGLVTGLLIGAIVGLIAAVVEIGNRLNDLQERLEESPPNRTN